MSIKDQIGAEHWQDCHEILCRTFPDRHDKITDQDVDAFAVELARRLGPRCPYAVPVGMEPVHAAAEGLRAPEEVEPDAGVKGYYLAAAYHSRVGRIAPYTAFLEHLPLVRVTLDRTEKRTYRTAIGDVYSGDHLLYSIDDVAVEYGSKYSGKLTQLDLVAPARGGPPLLESRFAAIAVYLGYLDGSDRPSFSIFEAGMATGEARMTYWGGRIGEEVVHQSGYKPTDFSRPFHYYHGRLTTAPNEPDEPGTFSILSTCEKDSGPRIRVTVTYEKQPKPVGIWPTVLTVHAAMRVAAIGQALGGEPTSIPLQALMGELGRKELRWEAPPGWVHDGK